MNASLSFRPLFVVGLLVFLAAAALAIFQPEASLGISILWVASVVLNILAFAKVEHNQSAFNVEQLLTRIISVGILVMLVNLLSPLADYLLGGKQHYLLKSLQLVVIYSSMTFILYSLSLYRRLHMKQEQAEVHRRWDHWLILLAVAALLHLPFWPIPAVLSGLFLIVALFGSCYFVLRVKWIALINRNGKLLSLAYLLVISLIFIGLIQGLVHLDVPQILPEGWIRSPFFILGISMVLMYNLFAILTLLFNMPLSSIQEQRSNEILSFHALHKSVVENEDPMHTCRLLFSICYEETLSDAAFMMLSPGKNSESIICSEGFDRDQIRGLLANETIQGHKNADVKENSSYYADLKKYPLNTDSEFPFRSLLVVPLVIEGELKLVLYLLKTFSDGFDHYNIQIAESFIDQTRLVLEKDQLLKNSIKADAARQELEIARKVQRSLLPSDFPESLYYEMSAYSETLSEVGGDYYDFLVLDEKRLAVIIADVSGSGASAAFHMAQMKGVFHALIQLNLPVELFLEMANSALGNTMNRNMFITMTYAEFDFEKNLVHYGRAGHTPVIYYSSLLEETICIEDEGMGLGLVRDESYRNYIKTYEIDLSPGDICVLFTDGISEGRPPNSNEMFGHERIQLMVSENPDVSAEQLQELILDDYFDFVGFDVKVDDHSLIVIKIK